MTMDLRPETARRYNRLRERSMDLDLQGEELQRTAGETVETLRPRAVERLGVEELVREILEGDERARGVREGGELDEEGMKDRVRRRGRRSVEEEVKRMERKRAEKVLRLLT